LAEELRQGAAKNEAEALEHTTKPWSFFSKPRQCCSNLRPVRRLHWWFLVGEPRGRSAFSIAAPAGFVEENPHSCDAPDGGRVHRPVFLFTRIRISRGAPSNGDLEGRNFTEKGCPDDSPPSRPRTSFPKRA
jgi:hypothetical protein